ncbi:MAG: HYR domain-containing protein, partial [Woeseiaceae bacterium]
PPPVEDLDLIDPNPSITNNAPAAGFQLSLGTPTVVVWTARDFAGNESTANQNVYIVDTDAPDITVPADITETSLSLSGKSIDFDVTTPLEIFPDTTVCVEDGTTTSIASGYLFPVGTTTVSCTATDTSGNSATDTFDVTVTFEYTPSGISGKTSGKAGSSFPLEWSWNAGGAPVSVDEQLLLITTEPGACPGISLEGIPSAEDPGSSGLRLQSDGSYQYNLQAVNPVSGDPLFAERPSSPYCFQVSLPTGEFQQLDLRIRP